MEQRAVVRFFTVKGLKARAIQIELESAYGIEVLAQPTWRSGGYAFAKAERVCLTISGPEGP
jgi:hypothetical protein